MPTSLAAPLLGVLSAASWGAADYCGGLASKRSPLLGVLLFGYAAGLACIGATALWLGEPAPAVAALAWAAGAGVAGTLGLASLYRGLAIGRMAVVAPVSAVLSAALPVAFGALTEGVPSPARLAGFALGLVGIWLVARTGAASVDRPGLLLALLAGCGFGGFLVLLHLGAEGGTFWPLAAARGTSLALVLAASLVRGQAWRPIPGALPLILLSGVLDAGGNALFLLASQAGRLDVAAVLSSMYPVGTVLLAAGLLGERVGRAQAVGIAAVLAAIVLISG
jgi:drug/metabolite transporter (DMT)-like permease